MSKLIPSPKISEEKSIKNYLNLWKKPQFFNKQSSTSIPGMR
ncbi:unnamed protein product [Debaryomyces tyrocola]|nr:unnamed protein product [Debaryomyces tyrocola]